MNAPFFQQTMSTRLADLSDAQDIARLNHWLQQHPHALPFHSPKWLTAIETGTAQKAFMLVAERSERLEGLLPFHLVHSPLFGRALVSSGFAVGGGILSYSDDASAMLARDMCVLAERWSCPSIELRGGYIADGTGWTGKSDAHANFRKPLQQDDDAELLAIPRKQRAEVRKGLEKGLTIEIGSGQRDVDWHYAVYAESVRNLGTPVFPKALMQSVLKAFAGDADILTVLDNGIPVASVLSLYHRQCVMPYWGGGTRDARRLRANDVMYYALMNHARRKGCTDFDFGRSKTGSGAYHFKKNWGFEPEPLAYAFYTADGQPPRDVNPNSPKYRAQIALWQRLPLAVANHIGPWIAKGLG
nr:FemAB family XrtA/PEP-CTERM system-associated protein [uncultured Sphingorhabdus sp.]